MSNSESNPSFTEPNLQVQPVFNLNSNQNNFQPDTTSIVSRSDDNSQNINNLGFNDTQFSQLSQSPFTINNENDFNNESINQNYEENFNEIAEVENDLQLYDLLPSYPNLEDPLFTSKLMSKVEFDGLKSERDDPAPLKGELHKHQLADVRYLMMRINDTLAAFKAPGTGKSRLAIGATEACKDRGMGSIIITKNKPGRNFFKSELKDYGGYTANVDHGSNIKLGKELAKSYAFKTQAKFAKDLSNKTDDEIRAEYSNKCIVIDEVHNLRQTTPLIVPPGGFTQDVISSYDLDDYEAKDELIDDNEDAAISDLETTKGEFKNPKEAKNAYIQFHRLLHLVRNCIVILLTGTSKQNVASEEASILNLILPLDKQLTPNLNYDNPSVDVFEPYLRGKIAYLREPTSEAVKREIGNYINPNRANAIPIYKCEMSHHQWNTYAAIKRDYQSRRQNAFDSAERFISLFVYPDGSYGGQGFERYVQPDPNNPLKYSFRIETGIVQEIANLQRLKELSTKFYESLINIFEAMKTTATSLDGTITEKIRGTYVNYFDYVNNGGILFGLVLQVYGFAMFNDNFPFIQYTQNGPQPSMPMAPRFAIITGKTSEVAIRRIIEAINSEFNMHGDYIKMLIITPAAREGISVFNGINMDAVTSQWNNATTHQAISRIFREGGHKLLIRKYGHIEVVVRRLAAVPPLDTPSLTDDYETIDVRMLHMSEDKDRGVKGMDRVDKILAYDAELHRQRNILPSDLENSRDCDYTVCNYTPYPYVWSVVTVVTPESTTGKSLNIENYRILIGYSKNLDQYRAFAIPLDNNNLIQELPINDNEVQLINGNVVDFQQFTELELTPWQFGIKYRNGTTLIASSSDSIGFVDFFPTSDDSSYFLYFHKEYIPFIEQRIIDVFRFNFFLTREDLYGLLGMSRRYVDLAIDEMIRSRFSLTNRFGFESYLKEEGNTLFLSSEREDNDYPLSYYSSRLQVSTNLNLEQYNNKLDDIYQSEIMRQIEQMNPNDPQTAELLKQSSMNAKINLLEESVIEKIRATSNYPIKCVGMDDSPLTVRKEALINMIFQVFNKNYFTLDAEPLGEITTLRNKLEKKQNRKKQTTIGNLDAAPPKPSARGRKQRHQHEVVLPIYRKPISLTAVEPTTIFNVVQVNTPKRVWLHTLYAKPKEKTNYKITTILRKVNAKIKILREEDIQRNNCEWRFADEAEQEIYAKYIEVQIQERSSADNQNRPLSGFVTTSDNKFRIKDYDMERKSKKTPDKRRDYRGKDCSTFPKERLIVLLGLLGVYPPNFAYKANFNMLTSFIQNKQIDLNTFVLEDLESTLRSISGVQQMLTPQEILFWKANFIYRWGLPNGPKKDVMCNAIKKKLDEKEIHERGWIKYES
jgi:hypothetical protein